LGEILGINAVYGGVIVHIVEENGDFEDLIEVGAGEFEDGFYVFEGLASRAPTLQLVIPQLHVGG